MTAVFGARGEDGRQLAWPLLAAAARVHWGWGELPPAARSPRGKPFFQGLPENCFSLSHSGGLALCALSDAPVGVDIEVVRPRRAGIARRVLTPAELAQFDGTWEDFYRLWTAKEAWCKREDSALYPPWEVEVPPGCCTALSGEGWRGSVCCHGPAPAGVVWLGLA